LILILAIMAISTKNAVFLRIFCLFRIKYGIYRYQEETRPWNWPNGLGGHEKLRMIIFKVWVLTSFCDYICYIWFWLSENAFLVKMAKLTSFRPNHKNFSGEPRIKNKNTKTYTEIENHRDESDFEKCPLSTHSNTLYFSLKNFFFHITIEFFFNNG
jgi:hypothetical protein